MNRIYIPTYGRVGNQRTYSWLTPELRERTVLAAPEDEAELLDMLGYPVIAHNETGIANTRQWIIDQHDVDKYGPVLYMLDDDFRFAKRRLDAPEKFEALDPEDPRMNDCFSDMDKIMSRVAMGGLSPRGGANRVTNPYLVNARLNGVWGVNVETLEKEGIRLDRLAFQEDFDTHLQLLTRGYPTARLNSYVYDQSASNAEGGCSVTRTDATQAEAGLQLWENFPNFVQLRDAKGWRGMGERRVDVTVQWKKAYEYGVSNRELLGLPEIELPDLSFLEEPSA